jgi:tRNA A58 N-methylase Trm61
MLADLVYVLALAYLLGEQSGNEAASREIGKAAQVYVLSYLPNKIFTMFRKSCKVLMPKGIFPVHS